MVTCPAGHPSATTDYCDECGLRIDAAPVPAARPVGAPGAGSAVPATPAMPAVDRERRCPACATELEPGSRFCEACGQDSTRPPPARPPSALPGPPVTGRWSVVATADRAWFDEVRAREGPDVATVQFPHYCPRRTFALAAPQMTIGRRSRSRGIDPEIDLSGPPLDPGVSSLHAVLLPRPDGGWDLTDVGSTNGTVVGGATDPIAPHEPVRLAAGDRIKIGAWTVLTVAVDGLDQSR